MAASRRWLLPLAAGLAVLALLVVVIVAVLHHPGPPPPGSGPGHGVAPPSPPPTPPPPDWASPRGGKNPGGNQRECILDVSMMPAATSCPCSPPPSGPTAVRVLNMNVQQEGNPSGKKFGCIGDVFVADCVDLLSIAEIDNATTLGLILAYADGGASNWAGAACSAANKACSGGTAGAGVGIAWRTDRFAAVTSANPPDGAFGPAVALPNGAWGVQVSAESEVGHSWMQYRKLIYVVLKRIGGGGAAPIIFGSVHLGRDNGDNPPSAEQGGNAGAAVGAAMKQNGATMAVIGGDWNPGAPGAIAKFGVAASSAGKTTGCATSAGCDVDLQIVAVNGSFSTSCPQRACWVARDHGGLAGTEVVVTPTA